MLLEEWCRQIEDYLEQPIQAGSTRADPGPRTELEYWQARMQRIISIMEQLRGKECKAVFGVLHAATRVSEVNPKSRQTVFNALRRWKQVDVSMTENYNEAKDNVKYLTTLDKFIEPLYVGTPATVIDALPALMSSVKMIHTIARYYNTTERMTALFSKITNQMITNCKDCILDGDEPDKLWEKDPLQLIQNFESCLRLNEHYQKQYHLTKEKLLSLPKGKQFDFNETMIFGRFDLFCRRVVKLVDMFGTIYQFKSLSQHRLDGMEKIVSNFRAITEEFRLKRHDLLDFQQNKFDRDYVEFNVRITDLETSLQQFINQCFDSSTSIEASLNLLRKFQAILKRDNLRNGLESKLTVIFLTYGRELEEVVKTYEKQKQSPPLVRNLPPVAGNITWSRHLLQRIEEPMRKFEKMPSLLSQRDSRRTVRVYNKVARALFEFESVWHQSWMQSVESAKAGLQATLIIRHPDNNQLYVNFDKEVFQLIRETKFLNRMGIEISESAKMALLQEEKFKHYHDELTHLLREYRRVGSLVKPITKNLLKPHLENLEFQLRPGMVSLTWSSMGIEEYIKSVWTVLNDLDQLVLTVNDLIENRIEANLKMVSRVLLVELPSEKELVLLDEFVQRQELHVRNMSALLLAKSSEIETAVNDLLGYIVAYPLDSHVRGVSEAEIIKLKAHYNGRVYESLFEATYNSLRAMKDRVCARRTADQLVLGPKPAMFEVELQLDGEHVRLSPSVEEIQKALNSGAVAVMKCSKMIEAWDINTIPKNVQLILNPNLPPVMGAGVQGTYYDRLMTDRKILKIVLMLVGSVESLQSECSRYLEKFNQYSWLWLDSIDKSYETFKEEEPTLDEFDHKLKGFVNLDKDIEIIESTHQISALMLTTSILKMSLKELGQKWREAFAKELHDQAFQRLETVADMIKKTTKKLNREVGEGDIDALGYVMQTLQEVREKESEIDLEMGPITKMYSILDNYLPNAMDKEEQDARALLPSNWNKLQHETQERHDSLSQQQADFKRKLIKIVNEFKQDVNRFRHDYDTHGPMVSGIPPRQAVERLKRFKEEYEVRKRKQDIYHMGEDLFGLQHQQYPKLDQTKKELGYLSQLYTLYVDVLDTIKEWTEYPWLEVPDHMEDMTKMVDQFAARCKKMPRQLREWPAYNELKTTLEDFQAVLPLVMDLSKKSIMARHWQSVMEITKHDLAVDSENFKLQDLIDAQLHNYAEEVSDICEGADKQLIIEDKLRDITAQWQGVLFDFNTWKTRDYPCVLAPPKVGETQEALEETMMALNTMNAQRHSLPFKEELLGLLQTLSDTQDTIERWYKVQQMWTSLESVFTGGDIAKQMPMEAKKFAQIDKDWIKIMQKSAETRNVVQCCQNDMLKQMLPVLSSGLETCQKSLESYLEGKRNKFPRFYFTSDPVLLKILSQGSDPESIQEDFEKLFDAVSRVQFDKNDRKKITKIKGVVGTAEETVDMATPVMAQGNIEDWLLALEVEMQRSIRRECRYASHDMGGVMTALSIKEFTDKNIGQVSLLGIQIIWTTDFQDALMRMSKEKDRAVMGAANKKFVQMLSDLIAACLTDLGPKMNRTKYETLVTIHVHQKDLFQEIWKKVKEHKVKDENDFEWLKQTRFFWKTDADHALISIADVDFIYSYEYLGCKERLVITPLTDRCYLTQSQALGMFFGGAPAGPAGTGKTETTKDMGRTLGVYVVVTNCSDQHRFRDMAKIFKGLCMSGLWGCFDEFNRIELEVLSVVAMQVESITQAKKQQSKTFVFPGEPAPIKLVPSVGYFITMNPGYAGRQELPENLKVLFRSVSMMVPNREIIMKVKLASVGYSMMDMLGKKFCILYNLCEQQLSKQRHYDFGLRNILSVLRTAGGVKRSEPPDTDEEMLFMRTVRDMNLSKLVADDVPLFLALLKDLFPKVKDPPKMSYESIERGTKMLVEQHKLIHEDSWVLKVIQLYETSLVRHGFMLVGPTLCGKSEIMGTLTGCLTEDGTQTRMVVMNPKAITDSQMYVIKDPVSEEWTPGVFACIWKKYNNRSLKYVTWIVCDGPVDAIWIENLNTVLDDNKILTLANNDRIPMTDNCRIVFEVENLRNASPATVSRAGIIFVSATDLGWEALVNSWLLLRNDLGSNRDQEVETLRPLFMKFLAEPPPNSGLCVNFYDWRMRNLRPCMEANDSILTVNMLNLLSACLKTSVEVNEVLTPEGYQRLLAYCVAWGFGGLLEMEERRKMHEKLMEVMQASGCTGSMPPCNGDETIFEYFPDQSDKTRPWVLWKPDEWKVPKKMNFSTLLIPTLDSTRAEFLLDIMAKMDMQKRPPTFKSALLVGGPGTAKTSTALLYTSKFSLEVMISKRINFSSATLPLGFQKTVEAEVERKTGKTFCPPGGKKMCVFIDDASMPLVNKWGDQVTNELTRQLMENQGFYFLDKDKRGDFKQIENLQFIGAMNQPGGGKNDIPNRLKSKFLCFNMVLPSTVSVDNIYGSITRARFRDKNGASPKVCEYAGKLTAATIDVWAKVQRSLLPTPSRFHYVFNMRELSRIFQGIVETPIECIPDENRLVSLWKHECTRVFADKLARQQDKDFIDKTITEFMHSHFGEQLSHANAGTNWWADFQRESMEDPETGDDIGAPKFYEQMYSFEHVRAKAYEYLTKFNDVYPAKKMLLVLFDDAMKHMMRINRTIQQKRGSGMLVGVGGSGKQSLARLSAFTSVHKCFQVTITKSYNDNTFFEDLRGLYVSAGQKGESQTFIFTDAEVKNESFLEYLNSILATGEVVGLFQKDERDGMCGEVRNDFVKENPGAEDNLVNLYAYFMNRLRDNLHIMFCFSPVSAKFAIRAQKFPAIFSSTNINWFLPWPEEALVAVGSASLNDFKISTPPEKKQQLYKLMGTFQGIVRDMCQVYFTRMRKNVYVTPKSYLCFVDFYKVLYKKKFEDVNILEKTVNNGLSKLAEASADVEKMKGELREQEKVLKVEEEKTNKLLVNVQTEKAKAEKKAKEVGIQSKGCQETAAKIQADKESANRDLEKAIPFLNAANEACNSIDKKDIGDLKANRKPADVIRFTFDGLLILRQLMVVPVASENKTINKLAVEFIHDSFEESATFMLGDMRFLPDLLDFATSQKDNINDETCELLQPYLRFDEDPKKHWGPFPFPVLDGDIAGKASNAAKGLCKFVGAMVQYHEAAKIVKPKIDYLKVQEARLQKANGELEAAEAELAKVEGEVAVLDEELQTAMDKKNALEASMLAAKRKMDAANKLLGGLAGENARWKEDSKNFATRRERLVGDVSMAAGFVTYCGPFNAEFREKINAEFLNDTAKLQVPSNDKVKIIEFLVDNATVGEWSMEGLPNDDLSVQNGIMVTSSSRYPLMMDPQGQALRWVKSREHYRIKDFMSQCITTLGNPRLKDQLELTMGEGLCLIIENVENEVDPMLDPVLDKAIIKKGKNMYINVSDQNMDFSPKFMLYMTSRLPNPHFSPELSAKCTIIDFTVTLKGLEQQLLTRVLSKEQRSLEESLAALKEEVTANTRSLKMLDDQLLFRLSNSTGNLLDDVELIDVLANTKAKAKEVEVKLADAAEKEIEINEKREQFRSVATRGSIMYFNMTDITLVVHPITGQPSGWMYNCSLMQFLEQFDISIVRSEKCQPTSKRVDKIIDYLTYQVYRYMNRGLFERDKMMFKLMFTLKIMTVAGMLASSDVAMFLKAGSALDVKSEKPNPLRWLSDKIWLNVIMLSRHPFGVDQVLFFRELIDFMTHNEVGWKKWFDENEPERCFVPDYEDRLIVEKTLGNFLRMVLVRCLREDRTVIACSEFINNQLSPRFTAPISDAIQDIYEESGARKPVLYLLTAGSDPTLSIDELAKKRKKFPTEKVSMEKDKRWLL
jgi:dynein heavy chain